MQSTPTPSKRHQPLHIYADNADYFVSVRTYDGIKILSDKRKEELIDLINKIFEKFSYTIFTFAILNNHYHLLFKSEKGTDLPEIFKMIHGSLSSQWNKEDNSRGRTVFQNYWDKIMRNEKNFWTRFNYTHNNPIKHGLVKNLKELKNYRFCGYQKWLKEKGEEWMNDCWQKYPIIEYGEPDEE